MSTLSGAWKITQQWGNTPAYSFEAHFYPDGTIKISADGGAGPFFGTYVITGTQIALAIGAFKAPHYSISSYIGHFVGHGMTGNVVGAQVNGKGSKGIWSAVQYELADVEEREFFIPAEQAV